MNCRQIQKLLHAHQDGELDIAHTVQIDEHLADCPDCFDLAQNLATLHRALQNKTLRHAAPDSLRQRMRAAAALAARAEREPSLAQSWMRHTRWTAAAAVLAAAALAAQFWPSRGEDRLLTELTSSHVRSLMVNHLTDVASTDQHTVKPWFDGKLDFAPPVKDLRESGFPLLGGRLDFIDGRPVAALVYARQKHLINLYVWPAKSLAETAPRGFVRNGYNLVQGTSRGMAFCAVSDLNGTELLDFVKTWSAPSAAL
jgi:anti-sigma factor RsiW